MKPHLFKMDQLDTQDDILTMDDDSLFHYGHLMDSGLLAVPFQQASLATSVDELIGNTPHPLMSTPGVGSDGVFPPLTSTIDEEPTMPTGFQPNVDIQPQNRQQIPEDTWTTLKPLIHKYYIKERRSLKQTMDIMKADHEFEPT